jgi:hypothetical protein
MKKILLAFVFAFVSQGAFAGAIVNGNFNSGLAGWQTFGNVAVYSNGSSNFAQLTAGMGSNVYTTLTQSLQLDAGDVLTGSADFHAADYLPYNDDAYVSINGVNLFFSSVSTVGDYGDSGWQMFTYVVPTAGTYVLQAGVANHPDNGLSSQLNVASFAVNGVSDVPEPASVALLGLGMLGVAAARRRKA